MLKYVVKRVLLAILTVIIISMITFFAMNAIPGGPFNKEKASSPAVIAELNARYNLDKPIFEQYLLYMKNLAHGELGVSLKNGREISAIIGLWDADAEQLTQDISFTYLTNNSEGNVKIAEAMQADFAQIGINMTIDQQETTICSSVVTTARISTGTLMMT